MILPVTSIECQNCEKQISVYGVNVPCPECKEVVAHDSSQHPQD